MEIEDLRQRIKKLTEEMEVAVFEKGLAAEENKDIRENFAYDYWHEKELSLVARIHKLMKEIKEMSPKKIKPKAKTKIETAKIKDLPKNKWL